MAQTMNASPSRPVATDGSGSGDPSSFYFNTRYSDGSAARGKMEYIENDEGREVAVYDRTGRAMSDREKERFVEKAEKHDYVQRWQLSPPNGEDLDRETVRDGTREVANEHVREKRSASVAYAVHDGKEGRTHSHVLIAGEESELRMNRSDISRTRAHAHEVLVEREREQERDRDRDRDRSRRTRVPEPRRGDPDHMSPLQRIRRERTVREKNRATASPEEKEERRRDARSAREITREREEREDRSPPSRGRIDSDARRERREQANERLDAERTRRDMTPEQARDRLSAEHERREIEQNRERVPDRKEREALAQAERERARRERRERSRGNERGMGR